jgi:hypothetical protein
MKVQEGLRCVCLSNGSSSGLQPPITMLQNGQQTKSVYRVKDKPAENILFRLQEGDKPFLI